MGKKFNKQNNYTNMKYKWKYSKLSIFYVRQKFLPYVTQHECWTEKIKSNTPWSNKKILCSGKWTFYLQSYITAILTTPGSTGKLTFNRPEVHEYFFVCNAVCNVIKNIVYWHRTTKTRYCEVRMLTAVAVCV